MRNKLDKYFWDAPISTFSKKFQVIRLLEYASFPDLFAYPIADLKASLPEINLDRCRIAEPRKALFKRLAPHLSASGSLEEAITRYVDTIFRERRKHRG